jgi:hypothetical protein
MGPMPHAMTMATCRRRVGTSKARSRCNWGDDPPRGRRSVHSRQEFLRSLTASHPPSWMVTWAPPVRFDERRWLVRSLQGRARNAFWAASLLGSPLPRKPGQRLCTGSDGHRRTGHSTRAGTTGIEIRAHANVSSTSGPAFVSVVAFSIARHSKLLAERRHYSHCACLALASACAQGKR